MFFFFFCDWWPASEGSLIFISTIYLKDTDKRKLGRPALLSHLHLLLTDCFCHRSKLLAWLLAGIVFLNYQQKNQTQASGNTYSANQPDSVLASGAHFLIWSDLLQDRSPLTELSFTSEGVIEWRKINGGINKSNHRIAPANLKHFNIWVSSVIVGGEGLYQLVCGYRQEGMTVWDPRCPIDVNWVFCLSTYPRRSSKIGLGGKLSSANSIIIDTACTLCLTMSASIWSKLEDQFQADQSSWELQKSRAHRGFFFSKGAVTESYWKKRGRYEVFCTVSSLLVVLSLGGPGLTTENIMVDKNNDMK